MVALDTYSFRARWLPCALLAAPLLVAALGWLPSMRAGLPAAGVLLVAIMPAAAHLARERGKALQAKLWAKWGGPPTTQLLRHGNKRLPAAKVGRVHQVLGQLFPDLRLPTADEQRAAPERADEVYQAAAEKLMARTRSKTTFALLFAENVSYGFWRNLLALRGPALWAEGAALLVALARVVQQTAAGKGLDEYGLAGVLVAAGLLVFFWRGVSEARLETAAYAYAERLIESAEQLAAAQDGKGAKE